MLFFLFVSFKKMSRPTTPSFPPHENNERDDSDDVYSEEDLGMMKTMELRRAAKRRKEGGINTTTAADDDAIDFDRTFALGKRLEMYIILFLTHFLYYTHREQDLPDGCSYTTSG